MFLETLHLGFLEQLHDGVKIAHEHKHRSRRRHVSDKDRHAEIRLSLTSRRTGYVLGCSRLTSRKDQDIVFPDEPGSCPAVPALERMG